MTTAAQCRAARALLGWSQADLAGRAGVGLSTLHYLEAETREVSAKSIAAIQAALQAGGVVFIDDNGGGSGVRFSKRQHSRGRRSDP